MYYTNLSGQTGSDIFYNAGLLPLCLFEWGMTLTVMSLPSQTLRRGEKNV